MSDSDLIPMHPPGSVPPSGTVPLSTTITDAPNAAAAGGGAPSGDDGQDMDVKDVLRAEMRKQDEAASAKAKPETDDAAEGEDKSDTAKGGTEDHDNPKSVEEPEDKADKTEKADKAKPETATADKAAPADKPEQREQAGGEDDRSAPPARLAEDARKVWRSTPRAVKAEFHRLESEIGRITQESGAALQLHQDLREYDEMARQRGTSIRRALGQYVAFDRAIQEDLGKGVAQIAKANGHSPQAAIASVLQAYGLTPQQYAQSVARNPQAHQIAPQVPRDPAIAHIAAQQQAILQRMQEQEQAQVRNSLQSEVMAWAKDKPDYSRLEGAIAEVLKSGIIERIHGNGLSVAQKLDAAYRMAGGNTEVIVPQAAEPEQPAAGKRPDPGRKSVRGAPSDGVSPVQDDQETDIREFLRKELRRMA